jgi:uncharacterized membrane protein YphA (DoxX/SURF4 family)
MKRTELCSLISGTVFLVSGIVKSINISNFSGLISSQYGFDNLQYLALPIVLSEVLLGLLLIFQIYLRRVALFGIVLLIVFTLIYLYGLVFNGIEDCGCFGNISVLNTSPVFTIVRNIVLVYLLVVVRKNKDIGNILAINKWNILVILAVMCIAAFMSGYSFRNPDKGRNKSDRFVADALENTPLKNFIATSKDSTYLVFAFTYRCPHCMNSIENLKQYESSDIVDKVIGLALADSIAEPLFKENFKPDFLIMNYSSNDLFKLTNTFPKAYYIKNDSVLMELSGELPCSYIFKGMIKDKE